MGKNKTKKLYVYTLIKGISERGNCYVRPIYFHLLLMKINQTVPYINRSHRYVLSTLPYHKLKLVITRKPNTQVSFLQLLVPGKHECLRDEIMKLILYTKILMSSCFE